MRGGRILPALEIGLEAKARKFATAVSRREAAARLKIAPSSAVNVLRLWKETGLWGPVRVAAYGTGKLKPHREFILAVVERQPDITVPELAEKLLASKGVKIDPSNLSKFLIAHGLSVKKDVAGSRARQTRARQGPGRTPGLSATA